MDISNLSPMVTWGINPGQGSEIGEKLPLLKNLDTDSRETVEQAYVHMGFKEGEPNWGKPIDVAFIGSCTNGRISDVRAAAEIAKDRKVNSKSGHWWFRDRNMLRSRRKRRFWTGSSPKRDFSGGMPDVPCTWR